MIKTQTSRELRLKRHKRIRKKVKGTLGCPRLCVYRSSSNIYAQIINDDEGCTLAEASTLDKGLKGVYGGNIDAASKVGDLIANRAKKKGISSVVFDRGGYLFHGRVKALADAARAAGLEF